MRLFIAFYWLIQCDVLKDAYEDVYFCDSLISMGQRHFCKLDSFSFCPILDCKKIIQHSTSKKKCICQLDVRSATIQCLCCRHLDKMNALSEAEEAPSYFEKNDNLFQFPRIRNFRACIIYNSKNKSTNFNEALRYAYRH